MNNYRIATVDAVRGSEIEATLSIEARGKPVKGQYVVLESDGDVLLGRISNVDLTNPVHGDDTFAPYIMMHGKVPEWSKEVDIERSKVEVISMVDRETKTRIPHRRNPSSGTDIVTATDYDLEQFRNERRHYAVLGHIPNSGLRATIINRHHGNFDSGGYGEARHCCIFGQNGSGKTVHATALIAAKLAAHPDMGLLMPDTAGDLSDPTKHSRGDFVWNYAEVLEQAGVRLDIVDIGDIRLTSRGVLKGLLGPFFRIHQSMDGEKAATLAGRVVEWMFDGDVVSSDLTGDRVLDGMIRHIGNVYAKNSRNEKIEDAENLRDEPGRRRAFDRDLAEIRKFFDGRETLRNLIRDVLRNSRKVIIRMDDSHLRAEQQEYVMREVMADLTREAQKIYQGGKGGTCNALVVLDEGARWVPEGNSDNGGIGPIIERAFRETRKYGLGWMVISQRPSDVSKAVLTQSHTRWFGRGVGTGNDGKHLENHVGKAGVEAYRQLEVQGGFFWVGVGMDANIGTEGTFFTLHPFGGNATEAFIDANPHIFGDR